MFIKTVVNAAPGDVDPTFNAGAFAHPVENPRVNAIAVQTDGKILVGGIFTNVAGTTRNFIARLNMDGSLDSSFTSPLQPFGGNSGMVLAITIQTDGKILAGGAFYVNNNYMNLVRLNTDGSLDGGFSVGNTNSSISAIVVQPDGKIIAGGNFGLIDNTACSNIARLNPNGTLETALGNVAGIASNVDAIALQPDGKIVIGGGFIIPGSTRARLARLNPDGTQDASFNVGSGANSDVYSLAIQPDNKILVGGYFTNISGAAQNAFARLNSDGTADSTFAPAFFAGSIVYATVLQPDGKIFIAGIFGVVNGTVRSRLARLNADGSLDSFYPAGGANNTVWTAARQADSKILIGGDFASVGGVARPQIARLLGNVVNSPPDAVDDTATTNEDTPVIVSVLANDTDPNGDTLTISSVTSGANGSAVNNGDGTVTYTPNANFNGSDAFTYSISDGNGGADTATVTVSVIAVNDPPVANSQIVTTNEDTVAAITLTATDIDGGALTYGVVTAPVNGTLGGAAPNLTYTPAPNYNGPDSFTFKANDGAADSNIATVNITVNAVNDPPIAVNNAYTTSEDTPLTDSAPGVLGNDIDIDSPVLTAVLVTGPSSGTVSLNTDGSFIYTPNTNFNGSDSFTYRASDGSLNSNIAAVSITVTALNDPPLAANDSYSTTLNTPLTISAPGVLANDTDVDSSSLTAIAVGAPAYGTLNLNASGSFTYTPQLNFTGTDTFTYQASDGALTSNIATVTITVSGTSNPTWRLSGNLNIARSGHTATLLPDGRVLVVGGTGFAIAARSAELYDPATGTWTRTGDLKYERYGHTATLLPNGKVLVAGSEFFTIFFDGGGISVNRTWGRSAELYDPATGTWSVTGSLTVDHARHTATSLPDGKVLVTGGFSRFSVSIIQGTTSEIYDPATRTWARTAQMPFARIGHSATLLQTGKVLVTGGSSFGPLPSPLAVSYLFDPATQSWAATGSLNVARASHTATLLQNGKVLVAAGNGASAAPRSAEIYDPATGLWTRTVDFPIIYRSIVGHTATLLPNGKVLIAGGLSTTIAPHRTCEVFDPAAGTWTRTADLNTARYLHTATLLNNGTVLAVGGSNNSFPGPTSSELYGPP